MKNQAYQQIRWTGFMIKEIAASRMDICKGCDRFNKHTKMCKECSCFMPAKVLLKKSFCPLLKWMPI